MQLGCWDCRRRGGRCQTALTKASRVLSRRVRSSDCLIASVACRVLATTNFVAVDPRKAAARDQFLLLSRNPGFQTCRFPRAASNGCGLPHELLPNPAKCVRRIAGQVNGTPPSR